MCRNIKVLFNFDPPATEIEIKEASLQFVRKISGFHNPADVNDEAFNLAVKDITNISKKLLSSLVTKAVKRDRATEAKKAHEQALARFGDHKH